MRDNLAIPENVYRKSYEFISCLALFSSNFVFYFLGFPGELVLITLVGVNTLFLLRLYQGLRIYRFRKNVKKLPVYALTADEIPVSDKAMFLGKGFLWTQIHTQRLMQVRSPEYKHLLNQSFWYKLARKYEIKIKGQNWLTKITSSSAKFNPVAPLPLVGGCSEIHGVELKEEDIFFNLMERVGHMVVLGTTRVGKTRLAETLITQDIRRGDVVITFDPKGDADLMLKMYTEAKKAKRTFYMFHLGFADISCKYNPIADYSRITEVATRIANQLPGEGNSSAFKNFVWRFVNVLAKTMQALSIKPTFLNIYKYAVNIDELASKYFKLLLKSENLEEDYDNAALNAATALDDEFDDDSIDFVLNDSKSALGHMNEHKTTKKGRNLNTMKLARYIKRKKLENSLFDAIFGILSNDRTHFEKLVGSLYTQTWYDVEAKIESVAKAGQIAGNLNSMIMLRVKTTETAEMLISQLPQVKVFTSVVSSAVTDNMSNDNEHFTSKNEDKITPESVPLISSADLISLPKGQAFALLDGGHLYKIRLPLPKAEPNSNNNSNNNNDSNIPQHINALSYNIYYVK